MNAPAPRPSIIQQLSSHRGGGQEASERLATDIVAYDTETSDADVRHGQILQFAGIVADDTMTPKVETVLRVRRLPYVVPSPEALAVTGFDPRELDSPDLPDEFEAARSINDFLKVPPGFRRIFCTFNGLQFDDELVRSTLHRCLIAPPWVTSGRDACRIDVLQLVKFVLAAAPEAISAKTNSETGKLSLRLESLCEANGIPIRAHDALADAKATLDLAKLIRERCPWAWDMALPNGSSMRTDKRLEQACRDGSVVWLFTHYSAPDLAPCLILGPNGKKGWLAVDLRRADGLPEIAGNVPLGKDSPFHLIRASNAPTLVPDSLLDRFPDADPAAAAEAAAKLSSRRDYIDAAVSAFKARTYEEQPDRTTEEKIYEGFVQGRDKWRCQDFHKATTWEDRARLSFEDPRLRDLAARLVLSNMSPEDLERVVGPEKAAAAAEACREAFARPHAHADARWMTLAKARPDADAAWHEWAASAFGEEPPAPAP